MIRTLLPRTLAAIGLLVLLALGGTQSVAAQTVSRAVAWQHFDVDLALRQDGSLDVTETQAIQFTGTYQQGYRLVPLDRTSGVSNVSVAELVNGSSVAYAPGAGQPDTYSTSTQSNGLQIDWWFPPTTNATRVFVVHYTVAGAARIYDAGDQLQWRAVYADRTGPVDASTVTVHLPADAQPADVLSAWYRYPASGSIGALSPIAQGTQVDGRTIQLALGPLPAQQGAEVRVQFPHGLLSAPPPAWQSGADRADWLQQTVAPLGGFLALLLSLGILGGGGALLVVLWVSSGRDPSIGSVPARLDEPPSHLAAPLAGTLVDKRASGREAVATLVDLADRGVIRVHNEQNPQLMGSPSEVRITLEAAIDAPGVRPYERTLLATLFGPHPSLPAEVLLSNVKLRFRAATPYVAAGLYEAVAQEGLFTANPETTRHHWRSVGVTVLSLGLVASVAAATLLAGTLPIAWLPGLALGILGACLIWLARAMPRRTQQGALEAARWRAFAAYLSETARGRASAPPLPAQYLAYAVAFGIDQSFVRHLESVGSPPPAWFDQNRWSRGPGGIVILPGGVYGGPWGGPAPNASGPIGAPGAPGPGGMPVPSAPNPQGWSDVLAGLLNAASEAMSHGGGSGGWSGGGFGGGGGGGGGSGGFQ